LHIFTGLWLIFVLVNGAVGQTSPEKCILSQTQVEALLAPILSLVRGSDNSTASGELPDLPSPCVGKEADLIESMVQLVQCGQIIDPEESQDERILAKRFTDFERSLQSMMGICDDATAAMFQQLRPELSQYKTKILELKRTLNYRILRMIFKGDTIHAVNATEKLANTSDAIPEVINLGYNPLNDTFLKELCKYAHEFKSHELSIKGYKTIWRNMEETRSLYTAYVLLLNYYLHQDMTTSDFVEQTDALKEEFQAFSIILGQAKEKKMKSITSDIADHNYQKVVTMGRQLGYKILNWHLADIIQNFYTPANLTKVSNLLDFFRVLPDMNNDCLAVESLYSLMKKNNQEKTFEAFTLWLYTRFDVQQNATFEKLEDANKIKCLRVYNSLDNLLDRHLTTYTDKLLAKEWRDIHQLHQMYPISMRWLLPDLIERFYTGEEGHAQILIELADHLPYLDDNIVALGALVDKQKKSGKENNFESLSAYAYLKTTMLQAEMQGLSSYYKKIGFSAMGQSPLWVRELVFRDTSNCVLVNRKFNQSLAVVKRENDTESWFEVSADPSLLDGLTWSISVSNMGYVSFESKSHPGVYLGRLEQNNSPKALSEDGESTRWRADKADDGFFHIFAKNSTG
jgi:hypothetical protein